MYISYKKVFLLAGVPVCTVYSPFSYRSISNMPVTRSSFSHYFTYILVFIDLMNLVWRQPVAEGLATVVSEASQGVASPRGVTPGAASEGKSRAGRGAARVRCWPMVRQSAMCGHSPATLPQPSHTYGIMLQMLYISYMLLCCSYSL